MSTGLLEHAPVPVDVARVSADVVGVCRRPFVRKVTDRLTGEVTSIPIPCGSTREDVCPSCADKKRRIRMQQCREGWHLTEDPLPPLEIEDDPEPAGSETESSDRRIRSTQRLDGFPDLPEVASEYTSVGRTFTDERTGATFRPSMFITLTLPSYGQIVPGTGVPVNAKTYDYRRAALDALFFSRLVDRWWQNLRRCAGYKVQYFGTVEPQKRLAPHLHTALRGAIPRQVLREVTAATYLALWWPSIDSVRFDQWRGDQLPQWDPVLRRYVDIDSAAVLPSWDEALDAVTEPMHVGKFGAQIDVKGILGDTKETKRAISYLCKYLTKSISGTYSGDRPSEDYETHINRMHAELRWLPCSESCDNWLRYGVTPKDPKPGLVPGECDAKAHDRDHLGIGGRRVLVSRHWTGKTLSEHQADRNDVVRAVLVEAGVEPPEARRLAADVLAEDGLPRFVWEDIPPEQRNYSAAIAHSIRQRRDWKKQYELAKALVRAGPAVDNSFGNVGRRKEDEGIH